MDEPTRGDITRLLEAAGGGSREAVDQLFPLVYDELRRLAGTQVQGEKTGHTLQPTALVHELYVKLLGQTTVGFADRHQFFGVASRAMRRILVDHARAKRSLKRGDGREPVPLDDALTLLEERAGDLEQLDDALGHLAQRDPVRAKLVELRFFGGLPMEQAAEALGLSLRTAERSWTLARAFLRANMAGSS